MTRTATLEGGQVLTGVHDEKACAGDKCPIHNVSFHNLVGMEQRWNAVYRRIERICTCGVWHIDPDDSTIYTEHDCCDLNCCGKTSDPLDLAPDCQHGYSYAYLEQNLTQGQLESFRRFMDGQTIMLCDGKRYNHDSREYEPSDCGLRGEAHGSVAYSHDFLRWTLRLPVID